MAPQADDNSHPPARRRGQRRPELELGPNLRAGILRQTDTTPPSWWRKRAARLWFIGRLVRDTGSIVPVFSLVIDPLSTLDRWLSGRVYTIGPRHQFNINWRHPLTPFVMLIVIPIGLVAIVVFNVYFWLGKLLRRR